MFFSSFYNCTLLLIAIATLYTSFAALFVLNVPPFLPVRYPKQAQTSTDSLAPVEVQRSVERLLIGKRKFGIQFIWNGYGLAVIQRDGNALSINGAQYSNDSTEYCKINGTLVILSNTRLLFTGTLHLYTRDCCGVIERTGTFTFAKRGKRKFWRLQEFNQLCSQYICAYYLDIFE